jgi:hypothetical protein
MHSAAITSEPAHSSPAPKPYPGGTPGSPTDQVLQDALTETHREAAVQGMMNAPAHGGRLPGHGGLFGAGGSASNTVHGAAGSGYGHADHNYGQQGRPSHTPQ